MDKIIASGMFLIKRDTHREIKQQEATWFSKKTTDYSRCFMLKYLLGFVTSSVIKFKLNLEEKRKPRLRHKALIVSYSTYIVM